MVRFFAVLSFMAILSLTSAQEPSACAISCASKAQGGSTCASFGDLQCVCSSDSFQAAVAKCVKQTCPSQLEAITKFGCETCKNVHVSTACKAIEGGGKHQLPPSPKPKKAETKASHTSKSLSCPEQCAAGNLKFSKCKSTDVTCLCADEDFTGRVRNCIAKKGCSYSSIAAYSKTCRAVKSPSKQEKPKKEQSKKTQPREEQPKNYHPRPHDIALPECAATCARASRGATNCDMTNSVCLSGDTKFQAAYVKCVMHHCHKKTAPTTEGAGSNKTHITSPSKQDSTNSSKSHTPSKSTTPVYPQCAIDCTHAVKEATKCKITDASCLCHDAAFQSAFLKCVDRQCSTKEQSEVIRTGEAECQKHAGVIPKTSSNNGTHKTSNSSSSQGEDHKNRTSSHPPSFGKTVSNSSTPPPSNITASTPDASPLNSTSATTGTNGSVDAATYRACASPCFAVAQSKSKTTCAPNDAACLCQDQAYQGAFGACVTQACNPDDLSNTIAVGTSQCKSVLSGGGGNSSSPGANNTAGSADTNTASNAKTSAAHVLGVSSGFTSIIFALLGIGSASIML